MRPRQHALVLLCTPALIALAGCEGRADSPQLATVVDVQPVTQTVETPRQVCEDVTTTSRAQERDGLVGGTVAGAVVGGLLGNQVGSGSGRKAATVAGAVAGGVAGREIDKRHDGGRVTTTTEQRCREVVDRSERVVGYDVTYEYDGRRDVVRMAQPPQGDTIPMRTTVRPEGAVDD